MKYHCLETATAREYKRHLRYSGYVCRFLADLIRVIATEIIDSELEELTELKEGNTVLIFYK